jgi:hypothetical protein
MPFWNGIAAFAAAVVALLLAPPPALAQSASPFDIAGVKLGQTIPEVVSAIRAFDPDMKVEIRRVHVSKFETCLRRIDSECGNWSEGLNQPLRSERDAFYKEQAALNETNSLVAGIVALNDSRQWNGDDYVSGEIDSIAVVVTPSPGAEKVITIGRVKALSAKKYGTEELLQQLKAKYGPVFTPLSPQNSDAFYVLMKGDRVVSTDSPTVKNCDELPELKPELSYQFQTMDAPLPFTAADRCGIQLAVQVLPHYANERYANAYGMFLSDAPALKANTPARTSAAKKMMDDLARDQLKATPKERL